jgi:hypothetical protein
MIWLGFSGSFDTFFTAPLSKELKRREKTTK